jgi:Bacterial regulatory proteins, gntR family
MSNEAMASLCVQKVRCGMRQVVIDWAFQVPTKTCSQKSVLLALTFFSDERGIARLSRGALAELTGWSPRTIRQALHDLEVEGLIGRSPGYSPDGTQLINRYEVHYA